MIQLADITSLIHFDEVSHTYTRVADNKPLCGVTTMLRKVGVSANYDGIAEDVLTLAADRGHCVHALCDLADANDHEVDEFDEIAVLQNLRDKGIVRLLEETYGMDLANEYFRLRSSAGFIPVASEYLVSDGKKIASCIDLVLTTEEMQKNNEVVLLDIKTTSSIHHEPLGWQLSIYRDLFEAQNPNIKVKGLMCVWLPKPQYGKCCIVEATSIKSQMEVVSLMMCFLDGKTYEQKQEIVNASSDLIPSQNEVITVLRAMDDLKKKETELKERLLAWMQENGHKKFENDDIIITRVLGGETTKFDSATFKKEQAELYNKYCKTTKTSDSLRIKIK